MAGYYLNDYKDGLTYWESVKVSADGSLILELREKPAGNCNGVTYYRRRMFYQDDIGKRIFKTKKEVLEHPKRV